MSNFSTALTLFQGHSSVKKLKLKSVISVSSSPSQIQALYDCHYLGCIRHVILFVFGGCSVEITDQLGI